jgi:hypothetical protein
MTGLPVQDNKSRAGRQNTAAMIGYGQAHDRHYMTARNRRLKRVAETGAPAQECLNRILEIGLPRQDSQDGTASLGQDCHGRTGRTG